MAATATLADVAAAAGVSLATASRALHGATGRTVRADLAQRVLAAARALNYVPNAAAQAMSRGRSSSIGLLVHDIADPFAGSVAAGVMAAAARSDLIVTVAATGGDPETEIRHLAELRRQRARAVILAGSRFTDPATEAALTAEIAEFSRAGGRVAAIGRPMPGVNTVVIDNAGGAEKLARLLVSLGYHSFAVLAGPENLATSEDRVAGFRAGLAALGVELPDEHVLSSQFSRDGGYAGMTELLGQGLDPDTVDAVFAVNDVMAVGAIAALAEHGYRVPRDVAIAGFEDVPMLRDIRPALTTVKLPLEEIGALATDLALDTTGDPDLVLHREVSVELAVRASTPER
ncbi:LacI family DNA-binding transcriptional regulator [Nakamurella lactea]|uniref:LacI family DNA-binding transcriptional regulator n=1 Tax=Nakamurella lactea TaxID=459515 RepID=UPI000425B43B|nr:LacI family DNA-binding transcriptional regulator [Nakamurella lactea]